jgi:hypothetical protein
LKKKKIYNNMSGPATGTLTLTLHRGIDLYDTNTIGKQDPYVKVSIGKEKQKTKVHNSGGKNPVWEQAILFNINTTDVKKDIVKFEVYDKETVSDDFIGSFAIFLAELAARPGKGVYQLTDKPNGKPRGTIEVTVAWNQTSGTPFGAVQQQQQFQQQPVQQQQFQQQPVQQQQFQQQPVQQQQFQQQQQYVQQPQQQQFQQQQQYVQQPQQQQFQQQQQYVQQPQQQYVQQPQQTYQQQVQPQSGYDQPISQINYDSKDGYDLDIYQDAQGRYIDSAGNQVDVNGNIIVPYNQVIYQPQTTVYRMGMPDVYLIGGVPRYMPHRRTRIRVYGRGGNRVIRHRRPIRVMTQRHAAVRIQANFRGMQVRRQQVALGRRVVAPVHRPVLRGPTVVRKTVVRPNGRVVNKTVVRTGGGRVVNKTVVRTGGGRRMGGKGGKRR